MRVHSIACDGVYNHRKLLSISSAPLCPIGTQAPGVSTLLGNGGIYDEGLPILRIMHPAQLAGFPLQ